MDAGLIGSLVVLALIDSTSFGTLVIPVWMMLAPGRLRVSRMLIYLTTVLVFYLGLGVALLLGATALLGIVRPVVDSAPAKWAQLVLGIVLIGAALVGARRKTAAPGPPGRLLRWREEAMTGAGSVRAVVGSALAAVGLEAASMLPYLAAIGLLTAASLPLPGAVALLAGYCLVMILPALVLLAVRMMAAHALRRGLERMNDWMTRSAAANIWWIIGILGLLCAQDAVRDLGLFGS